MTIEYRVTEYGPKIDTRIPARDVKFLERRWRTWIDGTLSDEDSRRSMQELSDAYIRTGYETILYDDNLAAFAPDPFKILAAIPKCADLKRIMNERKKQLKPGERLSHPMYGRQIKDFKRVTGFNPSIYTVTVIVPQITPDARVPIPEIAGVFNFQDGEGVTLDNAVITQLKFPTSRRLTLPSGTTLLELLNFDDYRIRLIKAKK